MFFTLYYIETYTKPKKEGIDLIYMYSGPIKSTYGNENVVLLKTAGLGWELKTMYIKIQKLILNNSSRFFLT